MLLVPRRRFHAGLIVLFVSLLSGCAVRLQQASLSSSELPSTQRKIPVEPTPTPPRGLRGAVSGSTTIVPGDSVGPLRLGDTRERALELFNEPTEEYTFDENSLGPCKRTEMHWNDLDLDNRGIFIYLKEGRIYQIESFTTRYITSEKLTSYISPQRVRRFFPHIRSYVLVHSGGKVDGGKDLIYWVDSSSGIAFGLYNNPMKHEREVGSVIVFEPGVGFLPRGCISPPQEWQEIEPFALEVGVK